MSASSPSATPRALNDAISTAAMRARVIPPPPKGLARLMPRVALSRRMMLMSIGAFLLALIVLGGAW
ncbi:MAG: hypothetical protein RLZZ324_1164, partial [Candidatus Parcubacteria bacterium]